MIFSRTAIEGVAIIDLEPREDFRGFFARTFCMRSSRPPGLTPS